MDYGACFCMNLRHGMFVAYAFQVAVISVDLVISYINISNPNLQIFFFRKRRRAERAGNSCLGDWDSHSFSWRFRAAEEILRGDRPALDDLVLRARPTAVLLRRALLLPLPDDLPGPHAVNSSHQCRHSDRYVNVHAENGRNGGAGGPGGGVAGSSKREI